MLVSVVEGRPVVKLLDFGIARLAEEAADEPAITRTDASVFTPEYAAPEQIRGEAVTTATDVYALGILLYELLVGERPYDLPSRARRAVEDAILNAEPQAPSTRLSRSTPDTSAAATTRGTTRSHLTRLLRSDLDHVTLKAMRKEPDRRYESAAALADDVARHLDGRPVEARGGAWRYRAGRFVHGTARRSASARRWCWSWPPGGSRSVAGRRGPSRAGHCRAGARARRRRSDAADADAGVRDGTVRIGQPRRLELRYRFGAHAARPRSRPHPHRPRRSALRPGPTDGRHGRHLPPLAVYDKTDTLLADALPLVPPTGTLADTTRADLLEYRGVLLRDLNRYDEAELLLDSAYAIHDALLGPDHRRTVTSLHELGLLYWSMDRLAEAAQAQERGLAFHRTQVPLDTPYVASALNNLGLTYWYSDSLRKAQTMLSESVDLHLAHFGRHVKSTSPLLNLGNVSSELGDEAEELRLKRLAYDIRRDALGPDHPSTASAQAQVAVCLLNEGQTTQALSMLEEAEAVYRTNLGDRSRTALIMRDHAKALYASGRNVEALKLALDARDMAYRTFSDGHQALRQVRPTRRSDRSRRVIDGCPWRKTCQVEQVSYLNPRRCRSGCAP